MYSAPGYEGVPKNEGVPEIQDKGRNISMVPSTDVREKVSL